MYKLSGDHWSGVTSDGWETQDPQFTEIEQAIRRLDGRVRTEVSVTEDEPFRYITVAGGPHLYLVTGETADDEILHLRSPAAGGEPISLICGGQRGDFQRSDVVESGAALDALRQFLARFPDGLGPEWLVE